MKAVFDRDKAMRIERLRHQLRNAVADGKPVAAIAKRLDAELAGAKSGEIELSKGTQVFVYHASQELPKCGKVTKVVTNPATFDTDYYVKVGQETVGPIHVSRLAQGYCR